MNIGDATRHIIVCCFYRTTFIYLRHTNLRRAYLIEELTSLGLSEQEAQVYICLTRARTQSASQIATKTTLNRSVTYGILESLLRKGLVNYVVVSGVKKFSATKPGVLVDFVKNKEEVVKRILPLLKAMPIEDDEPVNVEVFQGINGSLSVMKDILKTGGEYIAFGEDAGFQRVMGTLAKQYVRQLDEGKIKERLLVPQGQTVLRGKHTQVRYLSKEFELPSITAVYGDKVAMGIFQKPYYAIVIESKDLAITYRSLFEILWLAAEKKARPPVANSKTNTNKPN